MTGLKFFFTLTSFAALIQGNSQDISGNWKGKCYLPGSEDDTVVVYFEIIKGDTPNQFTGISTCLVDKKGDKYFYSKTAFVGAYNPQSKKYVITEKEMLQKTSISYALDKYTVWSAPDKKNNLTGKVKCMPNSEASFISCNEEWVVNLWRTTEQPPEIKRAEPLKRNDTVWIGNKTDTIWKTNRSDTIWVQRTNKPRWEFAAAVIIGGQSGDRLLKWSDFRAIEKMESRFAAETYWQIENNYEVLWLKNDTAGLAFYPRLLFAEEKSWTIPDRQTNKLLDHEELHFAIGRLCLVKLYITLRNTVFLKDEIAEKSSEVTLKIISEFIEMSKDYDAATEHGENKKKQKEWKDMILSKLAVLKAQI